MSIRLGKRDVGPGHAPYVIAEIGANHNGDMALCRKIIDAAVQCRVDAVKFQSWTSSSLISRTGYSGPLKEEDVKKYELTPAQHKEMAAYCKEKDITFCSSSFAPGEVDMLDELGAPFHKIASMDLNNLPFLRYVAKKGKPIVLSTGMGTMSEIARAIETIHEAGNEQIVLLHCIALYPPTYPDIHLNNIPMLAEAFGLPVGFSDHSLGFGATLAAIALGACAIEKHFTIDKMLEGWDHSISADPSEMSVIVKEGQNIQAALGGRARKVSAAEREKARYMRRSVVLKRAMKAGETIKESDLDYKRPGTGIRPDEVPALLGRALAKDMPADEVVSWSDVR
jgi:N-acetylneuraminate synthase